MGILVGCGYGQGAGWTFSTLAIIAARVVLGFLGFAGEGVVFVSEGEAEPAVAYFYVDSWLA